ncbi:nucleoside deaminase [Luteitalea sp.]|jgi:tRNA(adenine34) deaminase|uniref:nucleoside deaminase n=1 Tax=Luteitalea sp. TaxID=2004800 RepID=UPI0037CA2A5E
MATTADGHLPSPSLDHTHHMRRAIALTTNCPDLPFGAVIVSAETGDVVAEGWNRSGANPTWHGEIDAINRLADAGWGDRGPELVLYTTAEPCPMCMGAILWSGIGTVVYGTSIRTLRQQGWKQIDILAEEVARRSPGWTCAVIGGVLEQECDVLFQRART